MMTNALNEYFQRVICSLRRWIDSLNLVNCNALGRGSMKKQVSISSRTEFVPIEMVSADMNREHTGSVIVGSVALALGLWSLKAVQAKVPPLWNHAGVWQRPWLLRNGGCTPNWKLKGFLAACIFCCAPSYHPLPKATQSSHLHKYNSAVFFYPSLSPTGLSYGLISAHQLSLCIWACRYLIAVLLGFHLNQLVKVNFCTPLQWGKGEELKPRGSVFCIHWHTGSQTRFFPLLEVGSGCAKHDQYSWYLPSKEGTMWWTQRRI